MIRISKFIYHRLIFLSVFFGLLTSTVSLLAFHLIGETAKSGINNNNLVYFAALLFVFLISSSLSGLVAARFTSNAIKEIRTTLVDEILDRPLSSIEKIGSHQLHTVLTHDVNLIAAALKELPTLIYNTILLVACLGYLMYLSPIIFLCMLVLIFLTVAIDSLVIKKVSALSFDKREQQDILMKSFYGMVYGIKQLIVNPTRKSHFVKEELKSNINAIKSIEQDHSFFWDLNRNVNQFLIFVILGAVVLLGHQMGQPENIVNYLIAVTFLSGPFRYIVGYWPDVESARISINKIKSLELFENQQHTRPNTNSDQEITANLEWNTINLRNVSFAYNGTQGFSLQPFNLDIEKGDVIFIKGHNGSGKSTFLHVLLGLYKPSTGGISIGKQELHESLFAAYRNKMAIVLHEFNLFQTLLGKDGDAPLSEEVEELLTLFELTHKLEVKQNKIPDKRFSKGQTKRLALISAILEDKEIYVLDEWAAEQDPVFRRTFYHQILPWLKAKGKTVIAVTHDDAYYHCADKVISFENGCMTQLSEFEFKTNLNKSYASQMHSQDVEKSAL